MFLNVIMLSGLGAAAIPLVLHLLSRSRYKDVEWGAMLFLDPQDGQRQHSRRFSEILLLAIRTGIVAMLAVALARPIVRAQWAGTPTESQVTAVLLLDCSASMGFDENGRTRFQMAQAAARQILRALRPGDRVSLIEMGLPHTAAELEPTADLREIEARIDEAHLAPGSAGIRASLEMAADVLARFEKGARDLYIVCDQQALSWRGIDARWAGDWRARLVSGVGVRAPRIFVLPVGGSDADNLAVESIRLLNPPAIVGQGASIEVVVRNYGSVQHAAVPVGIEGQGLSLPQRTMNLGPGQSASMTFPVTFAQTGSQILTARIQSAGYVGDDQMDLAVDVIPPIRVLVISGDERADMAKSEADYLRWALMPHRSSGAVGADPCTVTVVAPQAWTEADLGRHDVVVLANVERFTPEQARALEKYVYGGGGLLVAPGSLCRVDDYNAQLYRDGAGILPAALAPPTPADGSASTSLLGLQTEHPIFQFLRGRSEIPAAAVYRYFPATPRPSGADVLGQYLNGDPFLIEGRPVHGGPVLLMTTPLDADWSALPLTNFYLPYIQSAVRRLAGAGVTQGNLLPGHPIRLGFDDYDAGRVVTVTRPDGRATRYELPTAQSELRFGDTEGAGVYRVSVQETGKPPAVSYYVVPPPREESDLTQLDEEKWHTLEQLVGFARVDPTKKPMAELLATGREGRELWGYLLAAVFVLSGLELLIARVASAEPKLETPGDIAERLALEAELDEEPIESMG